MSNRLKMANIQAIIGLLEQEWSYRRIARELGVDRETVARYDRLRRAQSKPAIVTPGSELPENSNPAIPAPGSERSLEDLIFIPERLHEAPRTPQEVYFNQEKLRDKTNAGSSTPNTALFLS